MTSEKQVRHGASNCIRWHAVKYPKAGESVCGDLFMIKEMGRQVLIAVTDGLGHGENAYEASLKALQALDRYSARSLISLVRKCHEDLKSTRGVVMNLAVIDPEDETLTWAGVGNVEGVLFRTGEESPGIENILQQRGVVGYNLPLVKASMMPLSPGDTLVFATDGIMTGFEHRIDFDEESSPEAIVSRILGSHYNGSDDALVLAARYTGSELSGPVL